MALPTAEPRDNGKDTDNDLLYKIAARLYGLGGVGASVTPSGPGTGGATEAKQDTQITHLSQIEAAVEGATPAGTNNIGDVDVLTLPATPAGTNSIGGTKDNGPHWTSVFGVAGVAFTSADATTAAAVTDAPTSGQKLVLTDLVMSSDTALFLLFHEESTAGTVIFKVFLPANGTVQITPRSKVKLPTINKKLMVDASAAGNIAVTATYFSEA